MGRVVILRVWISRLIGQLSSCLVSVHFPGPYFNRCPGVPDAIVPEGVKGSNLEDGLTLIVMLCQLLIELAGCVLSSKIRLTLF